MTQLAIISDFFMLCIKMPFMINGWIVYSIVYSIDTLFYSLDYRIDY